MRARWIVGIVAAGAVSIGGLIGGCMIFTGSTGGYTLVDSGPPDAGCTSAADCQDDGGATGQVCCLGIWSTSVGFACQSSCPALTSVQVCRSDTECGSARCVHQLCPVDGGIEYGIHACDLIPGCTAVPSTPTDGGSPDASSPPDAGTADSGTTDANIPDASTPDANIPDAPLDSAG